MAIDLVCGMEVDPATAKHTAVHEGTTYYFCAPGCRKAFLADPGHYLKPGAPAGKAQEYVAAGEAAFDRFLDSLTGFNAAKWEVAPTEGQWSLRDLLRHFGANTQGHVVEIRAILEGTPRFDRTNAPWKAEMDAAMAGGFESVVRFMRENHQEYLGYLKTLSDDVLDREAATGHGVTTVGRLLAHYATHGVEHAEQAAAIREAVGG